MSRWRRRFILVQLDNGCHQGHDVKHIRIASILSRIKRTVTLIFTCRQRFRLLRLFLFYQWLLFRVRVHHSLLLRHLLLRTATSVLVLLHHRPDLFLALRHRVDIPLLAHQVRDERMMPGSQPQHHGKVAPETVPIVRVLDHLPHRVCEIIANAALAEDEDAFRAAVHLAALATPPAVQLTAVFAAIKFAAIVKVVAFFADSDFEHRMQSDVGHVAEGGSNVVVARGAVDLELLDLGQVRKLLGERLQLGRSGIFVEQRIWNEIDCYI